MKLNVLSGKGGVGKSSIAASLAVLLARERKVVAVDCDVDAPNLGLCLGLHREDFDGKPVSTGEKARLLPDKCIKCHKCVDTCVFSAISWDDGPVFNDLLCEGCGACQLVCPVDAIELEPVENGWVGTAEKDFPVVGGWLKMGQSGSGDIVALVKERAEKVPHDVMVIDSAAGIGCPVIASVVGSDYVIAVTEPTPSALSDLKRALQVVRHFGIPCGLVINRADLNPGFTEKIKKWSSKNSLRVLAEIPYDRAFVEAIVQLTPPVVYKPGLEPLFQDLLALVFEDLGHS
ncbi:MAG: ATP-binding protein [Candidatus Diapherotrites archaeon]|nr:ATP-binding protein [Candidatus Diapherotrites archaeon]